MKIITRTIWILSLVSLFTDMASEMLYPIMPMFLRSIGFSFLLIGVLEGFAEAVAGLSKSYFGKRSDLSGRRLPFVQLGYALSAISKPMMSIFIYPVWIFLARSLDRIGKGLRTGARDALLSDESLPANKGRVFGFHRGMDTAGAVLGPSIALIYLYYHPVAYRQLFLVAFIPGMAAILCTLWIREKKKDHPKESILPKAGFFRIFDYWKNANADYRKLLLGLLAFALFNSSDAFLLLKMKESGFNDTLVVGIYIFYNLVYALLAYPIGILADRIGLKKVFCGGLLLFAIVYGGFAVNNNFMIYGLLFLFYGIYAAATEGISKAWISNLVPRQETATAIGTYTGLQSICALLASSLTGFLWYSFGSFATFTLTGVVTLAVVIYLFQIRMNPNHKTNINNGKL